MFDSWKLRYQVGKEIGKKIVKERGAFSAGALMATFIGIFVALIVITAMWPTLTAQLSTIKSDNNTSPTAKTFFSMYDWIIALGIFVAILSGFIYLKTR